MVLDGCGYRLVIWICISSLETIKEHRYIYIAIDLAKPYMALSEPIGASGIYLYIHLLYEHSGCEQVYKVDQFDHFCTLDIKKEQISTGLCSEMKKRPTLSADLF